MKFSAKRLVVAAVVSGGIGAVAFGGSAVSTAWSDSSTGHIKADAAKVSNVITTGDFSLSNALPGDKSAPVTIAYRNNGSTNEIITLSLTPSGAGLGDLAKHVTLVVPGVFSAHVSDLPGAVDLSKYPVPPNQGGTIATAYIQLDNDAPQSLQGTSFDAAYTVTATASH